MRLSKAFGRSPESRLQLHNQYNLAQLGAKGDPIQVERCQPAARRVAQALRRRVRRRLLQIDG